MQEVFSKIEELKNKLIVLKKNFELAKKENKILVEKIQSLEHEIKILKGKPGLKYDKNVEVEKIKEELSDYINEIEELIQILSE